MCYQLLTSFLRLPAATAFIALRISLLLRCIRNEIAATDVDAALTHAYTPAAGPMPWTPGNSASTCAMLHPVPWALAN